MSDWILLLLWFAVLAAGIGGCVLAHHLGLASTYARDLLHVGTGVWVLGWPLWEARLAPMLLVGSAALFTLAVPALAPRIRAATQLERAFASGDEQWTGLVLYTVAYAALTWIGLSGNAFAAAAGLLALSLGDGIGGLVGRRFGRHRFQAPGGKPKSWEGSIGVAVASTIAVLIAAWRFQTDTNLQTVAGLGAGAALAEAISPKSSDNLIVPAVVWGLAELMR